MTIIDEYTEIIETSGIRIPFIPRIITPKIERPMRNNRYEVGECTKLRETLTAEDRVLELGAGVGLISSVAGLVKDIRSVTTVEANPELIPIIKETHHLNGVKDIDLRNAVVVRGSRKRAPFYLRADFWASSMEPDSRPYKKKKHLDCVSIHNLIEEKNPTFIICDIEGGELGLFDDADLSGVRAMVVEFHPKVYGKKAADAITKLLESKGLLYREAEEPSSVRFFERSLDLKPASETARPALLKEYTKPTKSTKIVKPDLSGTPNRRWNPETARFLIATCMKDEGPFIIEWLAWHKSIGIQDIVVFTNHCTDGTEEMLDRLQEMGELRHLPNPAVVTNSCHFQPAALAYIPYLSEFRKADFFISIDVDEFINIDIGSGKLSELLRATGEFDALSMSELNHGSNMKEEYERGLLTDLFPYHQSLSPGKMRSVRGIKTILRRGEKLQYIRNHRPVLRNDRGHVTWLDGSGRELDTLHSDPDLNGIDVRGSYGLVKLDHFALRSLNSYLVKMFRGDVVVKNKMVSQRYWRLRDQNYENTSSFARQKPAFDTAYATLMEDKLLADLHDKCCSAHESRIAELLEQEVFVERKKWIFENIWKT